MRNPLIVLGASLLLSLAPPPAAAKTRALLVGVTAYPNLDSSLQLEGPRNDVELYRGFLLERGVAPEDITVLADDIAGARPPVRKEIVGALDALAAASSEGDFVFLLFAGHGSQQPAGEATAAQEPDGLDEIFLPRDIGQWSGELGAVENAIRDDELGAAIGRMRDKGAFVWAVFDSCHSGTITRALPNPGERERKVGPAALGIGPAALAKAQAAGERSRGGAAVEARTEAPPRAGGKRGGFVAFYAAQSHETTPEAYLPKDSPDPVARGLFSYTLFEVLAQSADITYRQAVDQVIQRYYGTPRAAPTPTYEGDALDATVWATTGTRVAQWRVDKTLDGLQLRAGLVHRVTPDSILALVPAATSKDGERIGYVRVTRAQATGAEVEPVAYDGVAAPDYAKLDKSVYARPVDLKIDFALRVSVVEGARACAAAEACCETPSAAVRDAIARTRKDAGEGARLRWVAKAEAADVQLCQKQGRIHFLDGSGAAPGAAGAPAFPSIEIAAGADAARETAGRLANALARIGRVGNLSRLAAQFGSGAARLEVGVQRAGAAGAEAVAAGTRAQFRDGDRVTVVLRNTSNLPVDVTVLYVDADYAIQVLYPGAGEINRIDPKGKVEFTNRVQAGTIGFERMVVVATAADRQAPISDFSFLAQDGLARTAQRGGAGSSVVGLIEDAGFGRQATRGMGRADASVASTQITVFGWDIVP